MVHFVVQAIDGDASAGSVRTQSWRVSGDTTRLAVSGSRAARIPPGVASFLRACDGAVATPPGPPPGQDTVFDALLDCLRPSLDAAQRAGTTALPATVILEGRRGSGRCTVVRAAAELAGLHWLEVRCSLPRQIN